MLKGRRAAREGQGFIRIERERRCLEFDIKTDIIRDVLAREREYQRLG